MATKKKTTRSSKAAASTTNGSALPEGFKPITGANGKPWDMEKMPSLVGLWEGVRTIQVKRGRKTEEQRLATVRADDGVSYTVWESAMLADLFEQAEPGKSEVAIVYQGLGKAKPGQNPPKLFEVGIR